MKYDIAYFHIFYLYYFYYCQGKITKELGIKQSTLQLNCLLCSINASNSGGRRHLNWLKYDAFYSVNQQGYDISN